LPTSAGSCRSPISRLTLPTVLDGVTAEGGVGLLICYELKQQRRYSDLERLLSPRALADDATQRPEAALLRRTSPVKG
jgi:hypothetical protein